MTVPSRLDPIAANDWQVVASLEEIPQGRVFRTTLLSQPICIAKLGEDAAVWRDDGRMHSNQPITTTQIRERLPVILRFGYVWASLGHPNRDLFEIPECAEPDRRHVVTGCIRVNVSAPRAVENFLDMGHFPFVHTNYLGEEPYTEVKPYQVEVTRSPNEVIATNCLFYQPKANTNATTGFEVEYVYRVPHPYCAILYKSAPEAPERRDVIALFCQPIEQDWMNAHVYMSLIDSVSTLAGMRRFQQTIFGQDRPILENQLPKRLPLDTRSEVPIRADAMSAAYRRYLRESGLWFGVIPVERPAGA
jgi:phenylpropionate dioxygenase-like ring-hydroxylating dioxygenase large terminal subunit